MINRITTWVLNQILTAANLNAEFNNIVNGMIPANIDDASADVASMQQSVSPGAAGTESLSTNLLGELQRIRFVINRIIGGPQWYATPLRTFDAALDAQTADFSNGSVSSAKQADMNYEISSIADNIVITGDTFADVTNLEVTITTSGRPVWLGLINESNLGFYTGYINVTTPAVALECQMQFIRDADVLVKYDILVDQHSYGGFRPALGKSSPISAYKIIDEPVAGTYTYKVQARATDLVNFASTMTFYGTKLLAIEL